MIPSHFKGWAIPGPIPPGTLGHGPEPEPGETLDAISGRFRLFQLSAGHRFSTDDVLTAWYGTSGCPCARTVLDLGSGIGTVGMIAAWRLPGARFVTVEAQEESVRLARKSAAWNGLTDRYEIRQGDLRDPAILGPDETFDLILGSPPYFPPGTGVHSDHPQRLACRFELREPSPITPPPPPPIWHRAGCLPVCFPSDPTTRPSASASELPLPGYRSSVSVRSSSAKARIRSLGCSSCTGPPTCPSASATPPTPNPRSSFASGTAPSPPNTPP